MINNRVIDRDLVLIPLIFVYRDDLDEVETEVGVNLAEDGLGHVEEFALCLV